MSPDHTAAGMWVSSWKLVRSEGTTASRPLGSVPRAVTWNPPAFPFIGTVVPPQAEYDSVSRNAEYEPCQSASAAVRLCRIGLIGNTAQPPILAPGRPARTCRESCGNPRHPARFSRAISFIDVTQGWGNSRSNQAGTRPGMMYLCDHRQAVEVGGANNNPSDPGVDGHDCRTRLLHGHRQEKAGR